MEYMWKGWGTFWVFYITIKPFWHMQLKSFQHFIHTCIYIHIHIYVYIHTYTNTYIYIYIHTYTHTHVHTHIPFEHSISSSSHSDICSWRVFNTSSIPPGGIITIILEDITTALCTYVQFVYAYNMYVYIYIYTPIHIRIMYIYACTYMHMYKCKL
jgi:hypothetical protein